MRRCVCCRNVDPSFVSDHERDLMTRWVSIVVGYPISRDEPEGKPRALLARRSYVAAGDEYLIASTFCCAAKVNGGWPTRCCAF